MADFTEAVMSHTTRYFGHADILPIMKVHSASKTYGATQYFSVCMSLLAVEKIPSVKKHKQFNRVCPYNIQSNLDLYI